MTVPESITWNLNDHFFDPQLAPQQVHDLVSLFVGDGIIEDQTHHRSRSTEDRHAASLRAVVNTLHVFNFELLHHKANVSTKKKARSEDRASSPRAKLRHSSIMGGP